VNCCSLRWSLRKEGEGLTWGVGASELWSGLRSIEVECVRVSCVGHDLGERP
jgi:hypothetical protein